MSKKTSKEDHTVIMSDKYLSESGVQGGKVISDHIALGSFIFGVPFFIMGLIGLFMLFGLGYPTNTANIILVLLLTVIGLLLIIGGYFSYRDKHAKN